MLLRSSTIACFVTGLLLFVSAAAFAQNAPTMKDGVYRKGGLTMRLQAGQSTRLSAPVTMNNGLVIRPDGIMVSRDGTRQMLEEGKAVNQQGQIVNLTDDMMSAPAIEQRARKVAGVTETRVVMPDAGIVPARLTTELLRTERRLALLQQLSDRLAERTGMAVGQNPAAAAIDAQLQSLEGQLKP